MMMLKSDMIGASDIRLTIGDLGTSTLYGFVKQTANYNKEDFCSLFLKISQDWQ